MVGARFLTLSVNRQVIRAHPKRFIGRITRAWPRCAGVVTPVDPALA